MAPETPGERRFWVTLESGEVVEKTESEINAMLDNYELKDTNPAMAYDRSGGWKTLADFELKNAF
jgi:hypothetical protein